METSTFVSTANPPVLSRRPVAILDAATGADGSLNKYATLLMPDQIQAKTGIRGEAVMGRFKDAQGPLSPENFVQNRDFVRFLQGVISRHAATCPALVDEARRIQKGVVYVLDGRREPGSQVLPEDVLGTASVNEARITGYQPAPGYAVFTKSGFMCLEQWLHDRVIEELMSLPVAKISVKTIGEDEPPAV